MKIFHVAIEALLASVIFLVSVEAWRMSNRIDADRTMIAKHERMCRGVALMLESAATAAEHGDRQAGRAALMWPGVLAGCAVVGQVDIDPISWCWIHDDMACLAREARVLARQMPGR